MGKANNLNRTIQTLLKEKCENVYYQKAAKIARYPYVVHDWEEVICDEIQRYQLDVNIYDISENTIRINDLADEIESMFKSSIISNKNHTLYTTINKRNKPISEKNDIHRTRILVDLLFYEGVE